MWRSLFYAVGIGLMILGGEALIFERVVVSDSAKFPKFLKGLFETNPRDTFVANASDPYSSGPYQSGSGTNGPRTGYDASGFGATTNPQPNQAFGRSPAVSRYGPSRFSGPQNGNYGGPRARVDLSRSGLTSAPSSNRNVSAYPVSYGTQAQAGRSGSAIGGVSGSSRTGSRTIVTKDWMPWSLLAAGAIVTLYTSSNRRSYD